MNLGQTQEQTAYLAGINSKFLQRIEDGRSQPTAYNLVRLAEALDSRISDLVNPESVHEPIPNEKEIAHIRKLLMTGSSRMAKLALALVEDVVKAGVP